MNLLLVVLGFLFVPCKIYPMEGPKKDAIEHLVDCEQKKQLKNQSSTPNNSGQNDSNCGSDSSMDSGEEVAVLAEVELSDIKTDNAAAPATASWERMQEFLSSSPTVGNSRAAPAGHIVVTIQADSTPSVESALQCEVEGADVLKQQAKNTYGPAPLRALERLTKGLDAQPGIYGGQGLPHYLQLKSDLDAYRIARDSNYEKNIKAHQSKAAGYGSARDIFDSNYSLERTIADLSEKKAVWSKKNQDAVSRKNALIIHNGAVNEDEAYLLLYDLAQSEFELLRVEDDLRLARAALKINNAAMDTVYTQQLTDIERSMKDYDDAQLKQTIFGYESNLKGSVHARAHLMAVIKGHQKSLHKDLEKSRSSLYKFNVFAESRNELNRRIADTQQALRAAQINIAQIDYENKNIIPRIVQSIKEQISQKSEQAIPVVISEDALFCKTMEEVRVAGVTHYTESYSLQNQTLSKLRQLGIDVQKEITLELSGNQIQHYIQQQLIDSLNKIGNIKITPDTQPLLRFAVKCNIEGQFLNKNNQPKLALYACQAGDAVIQCAATIADYGIAAVEGAFEGVQTTGFTIARIGRVTLDTVVFPEVYVPIIKEKFNRAVLLVSKLMNALTEDMTLLTKGDDVSLIKLGQRQINRGKAVGSVAQELATQWYSLPRRDRIKALSKFFTEWECFGVVGRTIGEYLELAKLAETIEATEEVTQKNPHQAFIAEVVNTTAEVFDKDPAVVERLLESVCSDSRFIDQIGKSHDSFSRQIGKLFSEPEAAQAIKNNDKVLHFLKDEAVRHFEEHGEKLMQAFGKILII